MAYSDQRGTKAESRALLLGKGSIGEIVVLMKTQGLFSQIKNEYASVLKDENIQNADTLIYYNDETGYWVNGYGSDFDRSYAERLIRFHGPAIRIPYYSPLYSEIVYFNSYDWNVYVDGGYAMQFQHGLIVGMIIITDDFITVLIIPIVITHGILWLDRHFKMELWLHGYYNGFYSGTTFMTHGITTANFVQANYYFRPGCVSVP